MKFPRRVLPVVLALSLAFAGCATPASRPLPGRPPIPPPPPPLASTQVEPFNLSDAKAAVLRYVDSGAYQRDLAAVAIEARNFLRQRAAARRPGERLAVVFDIDETVLSNLPVMRAEDFGYNPRDWAAWIDSANAPALAPVREIYLDARAADVAVLFLTGRKSPGESEATIKNLRREGLGDYAAIRFATDADPQKTAAGRKAAARAAWTAAGWTIVATVGDQASDLAGGHAERGFKLPNPFYRIP